LLGASGCASTIQLPTLPFPVRPNAKPFGGVLGASLSNPKTFSSVGPPTAAEGVAVVLVVTAAADPEGAGANWTLVSALEVAGVCEGRDEAASFLQPLSALASASKYRRVMDLMIASLSL
jgi:hypothetical protein